MFIDEVEVRFEAGKGGNGCVSFRREKFAPLGGPDGGDGGNGGSVILVAREGVDSLNLLAHRKSWKAEPGVNGTGTNCHGAGGKDCVIEVPPGTVVLDANQNFVIKDLAVAGDTVVVARGGQGGRGNNRFKTSTNRALLRDFTPGELGESRQVRLELKLIADVGLVGLPNAGKSTLLSRLSSARPKIAPYPFTTKHPNLGQVTIDGHRSFVMADIPGLIEGAHAGAGLGHEFLRHIERTGILVHLVEPEPVDGSDPLANYRTICGELKQYSEELSLRQEILVVTKADMPKAESIRAALAETTGRPVLLISAVTGQGLNQLVTTIAQTVKTPVARW